MSSEHVYDVGTVPDLYGIDVHVGVDHDAVTVNGLTLGAPRDEFMKLLMRADTEAKAYGEAARCPECHGEGVVAADGCTCGDGISAYGHEPGCGFEPCPAGCQLPAPA